ncbi:hypothetical protein HAX54_013794 [Datura stramonium]|uniref:NB-ARC domain-containing protein n=1 Tax=Datura stramonium TaxID=4076 RepID=A0ABS8TNP4_DATST|nr:hypothetical protein [Datura stramonium]
MEDIEICERIPASVKPSTRLSYRSIDEELVGFDIEAEIIIEKLVRGTREMDVISIVGMAGLGKTSLAYKVYNNCSITIHFDVRVWCTVSQTYNKRNLLLGILRQIMGDKSDNVDYPADELRRHLMGRRYLVVLDDIWEPEAWDDLGLCFPCRENGSRIMVTTRNEELARKRDASFWLEVAYDTSSYALEEIMKMIQSSYDVLAHDLKSCLLYMGLFPKGYQIPVSDLLNCWIAEEFVQTPMICLIDLVGRNLVVISKRRATGEMKCCIVPDQVREFCLRKIKEEKFMQLIVPHNPSKQRLCMYIHDTMTSDFKEFIAHPKFSIFNSKNLFPLLNKFRLIRVLHLLDIYLDNSWAASFQSLTHLRFLAIFVKVFDFKWVSHLLHLQTLRVRSSYIMISPAIWKMKKLRHVDINDFPITWEDDERVNFEESTDIVLDKLKTLGMCYMSVADMTPKFWEKFPNLQVLRLHINEFGEVPNYSGCFDFPSTLKVLSLSDIFLTDEIVSSIAKLVYLETLKLSEIYFTGEKIWDLNDNQFYGLKVLKLHHVFMTRWICSDESFPLLEKLVIKSCSKLEEIPFSFADIMSLQLIKLIDCSDSIIHSAVKIKEDIQELVGVDYLNLHILKN